MLNRDYLEYISKIDDDLKCLLAFEDVDVLRTADITQKSFEEIMQPYVQCLDIEALYCLCIYIIHLFVHNEVFVTQNPDEDEFFELLSKIRDKSINKISFSVTEASPVSITNLKFIRFVEKEIDAYRELIQFSQHNVVKMRVSEFMSKGDVRDFVLLILTELIKHETNSKKLSPAYKELVVRILYLFNLRTELYGIDSYCEREVYDSIKNKAKNLKWFPIPNTKETPYPSPQQIETHDRFKGRKVPKKYSIK